MTVIPDCSTKCWLNPAYIFRDECENGIYVWSFERGIYRVVKPLSYILRLCNGVSLCHLITFLKRVYKDLEKEDIIEMIKVLKERNLIIVSESKRIIKRPRYIVNCQKITGAKNAPDGIFFEITYRCNMKCIYCYTESSPNNSYKQPELSILEIYKLIDEAAELGVGILNLGGGEPLLRKDIVNIIRYAHERGLKTSLVTNGLLINKISARQLKRAGLDYIGISLDGPVHCHNKLRGYFEKVVKAIQILVEEGHWVFVNFVVSRVNVDWIEETIRLVKSLGVKRFRAIRLAPIGRGAIVNNLMLTPLEYSDFVRKLYVLSEKYSDEDFYVYKDYSFLRLTGIKPLKDEYRARMEWLEGYTGCLAARSFIFIDPYGNVYPCGYLRWPKFKLGNIREKSLAESWFEPQNDVVKELRELKSLNPICDSCGNKRYCGGGCRALAYTVYGDLYAGDPYCSIYTVRANKTRIKNVTPKD